MNVERVQIHIVKYAFHLSAIRNHTTLWITYKEKMKMNVIIGNSEKLYL